MPLYHYFGLDLFIKFSSNIGVSFFHLKLSVGNFSDIAHLYKSFASQYIRIMTLYFCHNPPCFNYLLLHIDGLHDIFQF